MLASCSFGPSAPEKAEAGTLNRAIEVLRAAPNPEKKKLFAALESAACEAPDLCELKRVCVSGFGRHLRALAETDRVRAVLAAGGTDTEATLILDRARGELGAAATELGHCADAQGAAQRKYKL